MDYETATRIDPGLYLMILVAVWAYISQEGRGL